MSETNEEAAARIVPDPSVMRSPAARILAAVLWCVPVVVAIRAAVGMIVGITADDASPFAASVAFFAQYGLVVNVAGAAIAVWLSVIGFLPGTAKYKSDQTLDLAVSPTPVDMGSEEPSIEVDVPLKVGNVESAEGPSATQDAYAPQWSRRVREAVGARVGRLRVRKHLRRLHGGQLAVLCAAAGVLAVGAFGLLSRAGASSRTEYVARCLLGRGPDADLTAWADSILGIERPPATVSSCTIYWERSSAGELFDTLFVLLTGTAAGVMLLLLVAIWIRLDTRNDSAVGTGID
jgi:hypothetical protein